MAKEPPLLPLLLLLQAHASFASLVARLSSPYLLSLSSIPVSTPIAHFFLSRTVEPPRHRFLVFPLLRTLPRLRTTQQIVHPLSLLLTLHSSDVDLRSSVLKDEEAVQQRDEGVEEDEEGEEWTKRGEGGGGG
jgi:hypothetical protein